MTEAALRQAVLAHCPDYRGVTYDLPPNGTTSLDCSLYVLRVFAAAGLPFPRGVRTAEQERAASDPVAWDAVQPGDLLFFEHTYEPGEPSAVGDGHVASHLGISLGAGTRQMWDCHERPESAVGLTALTSYWQDHLFEARRPRQFAASGPPPLPPGEVDTRLDLAAIIAQEREWGAALLVEVGRWADALDAARQGRRWTEVRNIAATMRRNASGGD